MPSVRPGGPARYFRFAVAVPGISRAPVAAQLCTLGVRRRAGVSRHSPATYDDIGLGGRTLEELREREGALRQAAADAGVTIRQEKGFSGQTTGVLCGHAIDLKAKSIALPSEWVEAVAVRERAPARLTCRAASHHAELIPPLSHHRQVPMNIRVLFVVSRLCCAAQGGQGQGRKYLCSERVVGNSLSLSLS
eukprot:Rhum_TRINITY_DN15319_c4_g3::Rhum_TRINITY_DN15319_c4_g3_i1::g.150710::m.150710